MEMMFESEEEWGEPLGKGREEGKEKEENRRQRRQSNILPSGPGEAAEVEKAPKRRQWPLASSSGPAIFSSAGSQRGWELRARSPGRPGYCTIWEEVNTSISASASASERYL